MLLEERFRERQKRQEANAIRVSRAEEQRADEMRRLQHEQVRAGYGHVYRHGIKLRLFSVQFFYAGQIGEIKIELVMRGD